MTQLWMNLALVFSLAYFARLVGVKIQTNTMVISRPNSFFVFGALASLVLVSGLRANIGDTYFYKHAYEINTFTWEFVQSHKDIGFAFLQMILKNVSDDPQVLIFTTALITNTLIVIVLYKYSRLLELSLYVYITGGLFLVSMNGIRQVLAAGIAFTALKYIMNGNWKRYTVIILIASLFHLSALILLPIYFLVQFKAWSKATVALLIFAVVIVVGFDQFSSLLFSAIEDTQYGYYENFDEGGASILRVAVFGAPIMIAYIGKDKLREIFPQSDYIVNLSLIGLVFMIVSTQNWIFARFSIYFSLYQLILVSWVVKLFRPRDEKMIYFAIIICYFAYYYFENVVSLNIEYRSDFLIW
ncbi:EpsG family protein [Halobacillus sp. BBL2006]|uniref:EpsG family protein n=1 Tax=Halobacillus sp. BBL2006 TaxID=1543706 RepID=UPI000541C283|nr:EpsG family protein [Halobacillus sp. BBL2006]KHE69245.1 capsular biosynthesis protein [Halobacillus sp. BBL2006]